MKISRHIPDYISLIGIFIFGIIGFIAFSYDKNFQMAIAIAAGCAYFAWGLIHHLIHKDLTLKVVIEYLIFSTLGTLLILSAMRLL